MDMIQTLAQELNVVVKVTKYELEKLFKRA